MSCEEETASECAAINVATYQNGDDFQLLLLFRYDDGRVFKLTGATINCKININGTVQTVSGVVSDSDAGEATLDILSALSLTMPSGSYSVLAAVTQLGKVKNHKFDPAFIIGE